MPEGPLCAALRACIADCAALTLADTPPYLELAAHCRAAHKQLVAPHRATAPMRLSFACDAALHGPPATEAMSGEAAPAVSPAAGGMRGERRARRTPHGQLSGAVPASHVPEDAGQRRLRPRGHAPEQAQP
mmetsp:Transcript_28131/g.64662  ORF Transcript_28131/g.64662 Transcript_28131/m.64662 type:complete len:131 (+) Transcript_28131:595-987(+)